MDQPLLQERLHPGWWSMAAAMAAGLAGTIAQANEKTDTLIVAAETPAGPGVTSSTG